MNESSLTEFMEQPSLYSDDRERTRNLLLLHIAASCPTDAQELSRRVTRPVKLVQEDLKELMRRDAVIVHEGTLRAPAAQRLISTADSLEVQKVHGLILAEIEAGLKVGAATLIALADSGCDDLTLLHALVNASVAAPEDTRVLAAIATVGRSRNITSGDIDVWRAQQFALAGDGALALSLLDPLLNADREETAQRATTVAAGIHLRQHALSRASVLYKHLGPEHVGRDAAWAVAAEVGRGDLAAAQDWLSTQRTNYLSNQEAGLADFATALLASVTDSGAVPLDLITRSVTALAPLGPELFLPLSPAAMGAIIALNCGETATADVLLRRGLDARLGGETGVRHQQLLLGWSHMLQGRLLSAEKLVTQISEPAALSGPELLLHGCLKAGLARRQSDFPAMRAEWRELRAKTFGLELSLFDLLPAGEFLIISARLGDTERVSSLLTQTTELLNGLNNPPLWATLFHWHGVQAAFQSENPTALIPHANALVRAGKRSTYAATLARAGRTWLKVLQRETDFESVAASVTALAEIGHTWDAARLAGQAALQHPERAEALSLMQLAREVTKEQEQQPTASARASHLTAREAQVARLVLDGQGYRSIGAQLFISPKTVEHHVARIKNRLGATSRGDLLEKLHDLFAAAGSEL